MLRTEIVNPDGNGGTITIEAPSPSDEPINLTFDASREVEKEPQSPSLGAHASSRDIQYSGAQAFSSAA
jgi:hypothetical protein